MFPQANSSKTKLRPETTSEKDVNGYSLGPT